MTARTEPKPGNSELAARARDIAGQAGAGTPERKAAGCLAVALGTTRTLAGARKVIGLIADLSVREHACALLDELLASSTRNVSTTLAATDKEFADLRRRVSAAKKDVREMDEAEVAAGRREPKTRREWEIRAGLPGIGADVRREAAEGRLGDHTEAAQVARPVPEL